MKSRSRSVLAKLVTLLALPLVSLVVLWGIAANATLSQGIDLLKINDEVGDVVNPLQELGRELRAERLESAIAAAAPDRNADALREQRERTDGALTRFRDRAISDANTDDVRTRIRTFLGTLDDLADRRAAIDRHTVSPLSVVDYFTTALDQSLPIVTTIPHLPVPDYALRANATLELATAIETQSQEMAVLAGAAATGRFAGEEYTRAVQLIGAQRRFYADVVPQLEPVDQNDYRDITTGSTARLVSAAENTVLGSGARNAATPIDADDWIANSRALSAQMVEYSIDVSERLFDDFIPTAAWVLIRIAIGGVLGLVAVIVSIVVSLRIGRSLVRELVGVQRSAQSLATYELPAVVRRLRAGESVDLDAEVQPMTGFTIKEIEGVAAAMDAARSTAVEVAIEEAQLRRGVREVFLNLARRSQALIHRQLTLLDAMERREKEPDELEDLFRLDHLATRMRRHAEDLIVLSGSTPGRGWRNPVPMVDVMRGAIAEVEDYARVRVTGTPRASLAGRGVSDVIHLLAELIENATSFSPPHTTVHVTGELVPAGFAIEIEDRGLGMPADQLEAANARLAEPPEFDLLHSERLGLFVVGQLARRHDIRVVLRGSPFGGTTAIVLVPIAMIVAPESPEPRERTDAFEVPLGGPATTGADTTTGVAATAEAAAGPPTLTVAPMPDPDEPPPVFDATAWSGGSDRNLLSGRATPETRPHRDAAGDAPVTTSHPPADDGTAGGLPPLSRRDPGAGWDHLTSQEPLPQRRRPDADDDPGAGHDVVAGAPAAVTDGGLPRRVRQASLAAPLRAGSGIPQAPVEPASMRPPEEIRAVMGSYQRGSLLGRSDAARTIGPDPAAGEPGQPEYGVAPGAGHGTSEEPLWSDEVPAGWGSGTDALEGER